MRICLLRVEGAFERARCKCEGHDTDRSTGSTSSGLLSPESPPGFGPTRHDRGLAGKASAEVFDHLPPRHLWRSTDLALLKTVPSPRRLVVALRSGRSLLYSFPSSSATTVARRSAYLWAASSEGASTITRIKGSVPDGRNSTRPSSPGSDSTSETASHTAAAPSRSTPRPTFTLIRTWGYSVIASSRSWRSSLPVPAITSRSRTAVKSPSPVFP